MTRMRACLRLVLGASLLTLSVPVTAHHSNAAFDQEKTVEVKGAVKLWRFSNPHPLLTLEVTDPDGHKSDWNITFGNSSATALRKRGWGGETFKAGEIVAAKGHPTKAPNIHEIDGATVTRADGRPVP